MPSFVHYTYLFKDGNFGTYHVDEFTPDPDLYVASWGVNLTETKNIAQGGEVHVTDQGDLLVVPPVVPNDGTV